MQHSHHPSPRKINTYYVDVAPDAESNEVDGKFRGAKKLHVNYSAC